MPSNFTILSVLFFNSAPVPKGLLLFSLTSFSSSRASQDRSCKPETSSASVPSDWGFEEGLQESSSEWGLQGKKVYGRLSGGDEKGARLSTSDGSLSAPSAPMAVTT